MLKKGIRNPAISKCETKVNILLWLHVSTLNIRLECLIEGFAQSSLDAVIFLLDPLIKEMQILLKVRQISIHPSIHLLSLIRGRVMGAGA